MDYIDLKGYKKAILFKGDSDVLLEQLKRYERCCSGGEEKIGIKIRYFKVEDNWIYVDFGYDENYNEWCFWHYQNLLIWLSDHGRCFCFGYTELGSYEDCFYSRINSEDDSGASVVGIFKGAEFLYEVPGFYLDWWTGEGCSPIGESYIFGRKLDVTLLRDMDNKEWSEFEMVVSD